MAKIDQQIEEVFCKPLLEMGSVAQRQMTSDEMAVLITVKKYKDNNNPELEKMYQDFLKICWFATVIKSRVEELGCEIDQSGIILMSVVSESVGKAVMYSIMMCHIAKNKGIKDLDVNSICTDIFPWGFYTDEALNTAWKAQKVKRPSTYSSDNLVDYSEAFASFKTKENV